LNSKEDFEWKLDRNFGGFGSIDKEYFPKYFWTFLQGFDDKTKQR
jgi:hypothetical protein